MDPSALETLPWNGEPSTVVVPSPNPNTSPGSAERVLHSRASIQAAPARLPSQEIIDHHLWFENSQPPETPSPPKGTPEGGSNDDQKKCSPTLEAIMEEEVPACH